MDVKERFLKYVTYHTTSDEDSETVPSTARQRVLGQALAEELAALGLQNVELDGSGYVYGVLPATPGREDLPALGFIAHMDTAPGVSGENVKPRCLRYEGGDIELGNGEALRVKDFPNLAKYVGQELIEVFKCTDSPVAQFPTLWSQFQTRLASLEERCVQFLFQAAYLIAQSGRMALHHGRGLPDIFSLRCVIEGPETLNEVAI